MQDQVLKRKSENLILNSKKQKKDVSNQDVLNLLSLTHTCEQNIHPLVDLDDSPSAVNKNAALPHPAMNNDPNLAMNRNVALPHPAMNKNAALPHPAMNKNVALPHPAMNKNAALPHPAMNNDPNPAMNNDPNPAMNRNVALPHPAMNNNLNPAMNRNQVLNLQIQQQQQLLELQRQQQQRLASQPKPDPINSHPAMNRNYALPNPGMNKNAALPRPAMNNNPNACLVIPNPNQITNPDSISRNVVNNNSLPSQTSPCRAHFRPNVDNRYHNFDPSAICICSPAVQKIDNWINEKKYNTDPQGLIMTHNAGKWDNDNAWGYVVFQPCQITAFTTLMNLVRISETTEIHEIIIKVSLKNTSHILSLLFATNNDERVIGLLEWFSNCLVRK